MSGLRWAEKLRQFNEEHSSQVKGMTLLWSPLLGVGLSCLAGAGVGACIICGHESGIVESQQGDDELLEEYYTQFKDRAEDKKYDLIPKFYSKV